MTIICTIVAGFILLAWIGHRATSPKKHWTAEDRRAFAASEASYWDRCRRDDAAR